MSTRLYSTLLFITVALAGCGAADGDETDGASTDASTGASTGTDDSTAGATTDADDDPTGEATGEPEGCGLVEVPCLDAAIQDLSLQDDKVSDAAVDNREDGADWVSVIDASAGGTMAASMNPWVYLRFTDDGLQRVDVDDVTAAERGDWDIAAKRYGIRVNSGTSGPSCVTVAAPDGDYAGVTAPPPDDAFAVEDYYDDACAILEDGSGLPGNPDYRMKRWWGYTGCVTTTGAPFVLRLADGRALKLVVEAYYEQGQEACNESGAMGMGSGIMTWRWSFLP